MKYVKLKSLTWWSSVVPLGMGLFISTEPVHHLTAYVDSAREMTQLPAPVLINMGLAGIGLRGAFND